MRASPDRAAHQRQEGEKMLYRRLGFRVSPTNRLHLREVDELMGALPTTVTEQVTASIRRNVSAFDDSVQFGLVRLRLGEIQSLNQSSVTIIE